MNEEKPIEKMIAAPARAIDKTVEVSKSVKDSIMNQTQVKQVKHYWEILGPGLTTGASDDDPSGIATYSQTGARYGFQLLWLSVVTFPLMAVVQEMCARIGIRTGRGLADNIRRNFSPSVLYFCTILLFIANTFNIGADLGAMAKATQLLYPQAGFVFLITGFAVISIGLQIYSTYEKFARYLKWLALILLAYVLTAFLTNGIDWAEVLRASVVPSLDFSKDQILLVCAILGTTISPYLFFWQTSQEVEETVGVKQQIMIGKQYLNKAIKNMRVDVWSGMFLSNIVMFFIIVTCSATLNKAGIFEVNSAADAAAALKPLAGDKAYLLFALGIIGTGLLALPVLAGSAAYAVSESLEWNEGLSKKVKNAYSFYGVMILAILIGLGLNFVGFDAMQMLIYAAVLNGLVAPVVLVFIVILSSKQKVMGDHVNSKLLSTLGWIIVSLMGVVAIATLYSIIF